MSDHDEAMAIVRALASIEDPTKEILIPDYSLSYECVFCSVKADFLDTVEHAEKCPWLRARRLVMRNGQ
jgi:hypothetical protein